MLKNSATAAGTSAYAKRFPALSGNFRPMLGLAVVRTGIVGPGDMVEGSHCMTPRYLDAMLEQSRANLGLETIDIYYVHNPESQLGAVRRDEFGTRIRRAFEFLEAAASDGKIRFYGTATWNGFRVAPTDRSYHSLIDIVKIAEEVGGKEH